jgi:hypothetical protein
LEDAVDIKTDYRMNNIKADNDFLSTLLSLYKCIPSFDAIQNEILTAFLNKLLINDYQ